MKTFAIICMVAALGFIANAASTNDSNACCNKSTKCCCSQCTCKDCKPNCSCGCKCCK